MTVFDCKINFLYFRFLFATLLFHNNPTNPNALELWEAFRDPMTEDYRHEVDDAKYHKGLGVSIPFQF